MKRTPLKRRTPLRFRSKRRTLLMVERRILVAHLLAQRPRCQFPDCTNLSEHVHEILPRGRGGSILDETNCLPVCATHHRFIHDNPHTAFELGLLRHSWE